MIALPFLADVKRVVMRSLPVRAVLGAGMAMLGLGLHGLIAGVLGGNVLYMLFFPVMVCAGFLLGMWAGAACTLVSGGIIWLVLMEVPATPGDAVAFITFLLTGLFISAVGGLARSAMQHEAARRRVEERFDRLAELTPQLVWSAGPDGIVDHYNTRSVLYAGVSRSDDGEWRWRPAIHPADAEASRIAWAKSLRTGEPYAIEHRIRMKDGSYRWHLSRAEAVYEGGRIERWIGTAADIHDLKRAEQVVRESEARYRAVVEGQAELVSRFRRDGTLLFVNGAYARSRGTIPEALVGTNLWVAVAAEDRAGIEAMLDALRPESPEIHIENRFETADGVRWMLWHNRALLFDEDGRAVELQSAGIDITDRKHAEEALKRANADLLQFASAASHDLKEPLRGISRLASFISADEPDLSASSKERLDRIRLLCGRLTDMVGGLLEHVRMGQGPQRAACDLNEVVRRVVDTSADELRARRCVLTMRGVLPMVYADEVLMERVVANLIANAVKFNESEIKRIEIFWDDQAGGVENWASAGGALAVRDNGIGIDPRHQKSIFRVFRRVYGPDRYPGDGLGLALARKIVEAHGGTLAVESAVNEGSTFRAYLTVMTPGSGEGETVLVRPAVKAEREPEPAMGFDEELGGGVRGGVESGARGRAGRGR